MVRKWKLKEGDYIDSSAIYYSGKSLDEVLTSKINSLTTLLGKGGIESCLLSTNGYVRFKGGLQVAWKSSSVTAGGTLWNTTYPIYYSDHSLGNWATNFTGIYFTTAMGNNATYWYNVSKVGNTSAGTVRCFRPNASTASITVYALAVGKWN